MLKRHRCIDLTILLGNALDHFDASLYSFLVPIMAPLFFPNHDHLTQILLGYSILATSIITRPLGAFFFGLFASRWGPLRGLSYSLMGACIASLTLSFIPTYTQIGPMAPLLLILLRFIRGIFSAGESTIAKLYILENKEDREVLGHSYLYPACAMIGIVLASFLTTIMSFFAEFENLWRLCFIASSSIGVVSSLLRRTDVPCSTSKQQLTQVKATLKSLLQERWIVFKVFITTGLSSITDHFPFLLLNTIIPLITPFSFQTMMAINTVLLVLDMILIPGMGTFLKKKNIRIQPTLIISSGILALSIPILFSFIDSKSTLLYITFVRVWMVFWGIVFLCPQHAYYHQCSQNVKNAQYLIVGMGNALGACVIGKLTPVAMMALFKTTGSITLIGVFGGCIALITTLSLLKNESILFFKHLNLMKNFTKNIFLKSKKILIFFLK